MSSVASRPYAPVHQGNALRRAIGLIDRRLSQMQDVQAYSDDATCILRYALAPAPRALQLSDGTRIAAGDRLIDLHCWNERIPAIQEGGADLTWAKQAASGLKHSLHLLARAIPRLPDLREARACRARVNFVGKGRSNASVSRIIHRLGFEDVDEGARTTPAQIHDGLENILIGCLVWTHNPEAFRRDKLIRERRPVWSSCARLIKLHAHAAEEDHGPAACTD